MAWKFVIACLRCKFLGYRRREKPCIGCTKKSSFANPKRFEKRAPREARR